MGKYLKIELGSSFLLNAGIAGFIRFLRENSAEEDEDYIIKGQALYVNKDYLKNEDISQMYVDTIAEILGKTSRLNNLLNKKSQIDSLFSDAMEKETEKIISNYYKDVVYNLEKNSIKAAYEICKNYPELNQMDLSLISQLKKEKDLYKKKTKFEEIYKIITQPKLCNIMVFKELMYGKINLFFDGTSFFLPNMIKLPIEQCYDKDFLAPLRSEMDYEKKKTNCCIECTALSQGKKSISFMLDTTDDVSRKKSSYWNCKPDAFVCPACAFIYSFVPLGFEFLGQDTVFVNNNSSVKSLISIMDIYRNKVDGKAETTSLMSRAYKAFTSEKVEMLRNKVSGIQVIVRSSKSDHYQFSIINKDIIQKLVKCKKYLSNLENIIYKNGENWVNIYDQTFLNIINNSSQYTLINKEIKHHLKDNLNTNFVLNILYTEIYFRGGKDVDELKKNVDVAFAVGKDMRHKATDLAEEKDIDNSLRGLIYKLTNALSVSNIDGYMNVIIRLYSGKGLPIPYIFKQMYLSDEQFKAIGTGFILGLKYVKYEKKSKVEE